ncbi:6-phosphogluconolactonase [Microcaecilia unicolor]|uniref:6-phosphogluconolactonase n=1 Tax=Microcaecilia unicolor TaxID=1415580 RepID=A0A6P7XQN6_9AMPH|nr:6-phosphogluconolactonase [Microcaecilia unicolor]
MAAGALAGLGRLVQVFPSPPELAASLWQLLLQEETRALASPRRRFALGLSGGGLVSLLSREPPRAGALSAPHWLIAFCDERLLDFSDPESTYGAYRTSLLSKIAIPENQVLTINPALPVEEAAADYARKLKEEFPEDDIPIFDLLILGLGPDGHTASLFPDHPLLEEEEKIVAPISDSPKPPPQRVTLTLPVLNAARTVVFVATGDSKAAVLKRVLETEEKAPLPAARVQPHSGKLLWFLDEAAAKDLTGPVEKHSVL